MFADRKRPFSNILRSQCYQSHLALPKTQLDSDEALRRARSLFLQNVRYKIRVIQSVIEESGFVKGVGRV